MNGINSQTGKKLSGIDHLRQSIGDILSTRKGTRVMRRDYGSDIPGLIDAPINQHTVALIQMAAVDAIDKHEPRLRLDALNVLKAKPGLIEIEVTGEYLPDGRPVTLDGILVESHGEKS